jgi:Raf kinase inhibitor-like YbhB/YbcL family protein
VAIIVFCILIFYFLRRDMNKKYYILFMLLILLCGVGQNSVAQKGDQIMAITVTSSAFKEGQMIPAKYTCDGDNISPSLNWQQVPQGVKSFALISDDPDAPVGIWVHWVLWNIPAESNGLPEAIPASPQLPDGSKQGVTSARSHGYHGPCPPSGTHRYFFKIYALDTMLDLSESSKKQDLLEAMKGHILAEGSLMGKYKRK